MRYSIDDLDVNEEQAQKDGMRDRVTMEQLEFWLGSDNPYGNLMELALDIINDIYTVEDCVQDVKEHWEEK